MDEEQRDELERQRIRHERMMRRKQEKIRQLRRRKMMRIGAMAVVLVFVLFFAGRGVVKLFSGVHIKNSSAKNANSSTVEVQAAEDTGEAGKQPVMSASDVDKLKAAPSIGWHQDENGWWYQNRDGSYYQDGWQEVNGSTYYFNSNGYILTGWQTIDDKDCYFDEDGKYDETKQRPMIALTFDDGPGEYTEELINCLVENNAKATFFMLGQNVEAYPEIAKELSDAGMELGNHSYSGYAYNSSSISSPEEIELYTNRLIRAMQSGLYKYVAHPDIFMAGYKEFDHHCLEATKKICEEALKLDLPLEYNAEGLRDTLSGRIWKNGTNIGYPHPEFWKVVKQYKNRVIIGADAHTSSALNDLAIEEAQKRVKELGLNLIDEISFE